MVLNQEKCKYRISQLDFLGYKITHEGILPSDSKREAVMGFRSPENESEVRSFLGLANYMGKFIPDLATIDEPLRRLTQKGVAFAWGKMEQSAFIEIKSRIAKASCLGFYNLEDETSLIADASPHALGAVLIQTDNKNESRVIGFASKSLTNTERRYCHSEKEALALVWGVERFQTYLIGRTFNLLTDCKALTYLFTPTSRPCARIERWVLRLQSFNYKIVYISGPLNIADVLSRLSTMLPKPFDETEELLVHEIATTVATAVALKWEDFKTASRGDKQINDIFEALESGCTDELPLVYRSTFNELCRVDDVLLRGDRIVVPEMLQNHVIQIAHEGHPGVRIMKAHLRAHVWWPKMDKQVEKFVKACRGCILTSAPNPPEPMVRKELPTQPWQQIAIDFLGPLPDGETLLVIVDYYSRYLEVVEMSSITTESTIRELLTVFSRYGVPDVLRADNGPQFSSDEFRVFCTEYGIKLESTIPYWPQMNGEVERQNRSILKRLRIAQELGKDWRIELRKYLMMYHAATHSTTGKAPMELMYGRKMRTKLPVVPSIAAEYEEVKEKDTVEKEKGKQYADNKRRAKPTDIETGDQVLVKRTRKEHKLNSDYSPEVFDVLRKKGTDVTIRSTSSGKQFRRSAAHLKVVPPNECGTNEDLSDSENLDRGECGSDAVENAEPTQVDESPGEPGSKRVRKESSRLRDFLTY